MRTVSPQGLLRRCLVLLPLLLAAVFLFAQHTVPATLAQGPDTKQDDAAARADYMKQVAESGAPLENLTPLGATPCVDGFAGEYPCSNVDLLSFLPNASIGGGGANDIWGWTDPQTGHEYALMGRTNGTSFVDVTDPVNPIYLGNLPTHTGTSTWRDVKVYEDHAFVVSDLNSNHGMQVFDLNQLRDVTTPPVTFAETTWYGQVGSAHNVAINEETGFAYIVGASACSGGLHMVNIQDPVNPTFAGCFSADGYTHDVQCVVYSGPDADHQGDEICLASNEDTLTVVDVTNKSNPVLLSRMPYAGSGYTHQGWLTEDQTFFYLDDELDETSFGHNTHTYIWDVANLEAPVLVNTYVAPVPSSDHNQYIHEGFAYQSNYSGGLRVLDITDVASPVEVGYFDVFPANNNAGFDGSWSNYPYFESGVVIVTGRDRGLFVVDPAIDPDFTLMAAEETLSVCGDDSTSTTLSLSPRAGYSGSVTLSATGLPTGATASFSVNPVTVPGDSELTVSTSGVAAGSYLFVVEATDGTLTHEIPLTLNVYVGAPDAPTLLSPANGSTGQGTSPAFSWNEADGGATYTFELASDADFNNIIESASGLSETTYTISTVLDPLTTYYWRVRASNDCGVGANSSVFQFTTGNIITETFLSTDVPLPIGPNGGTNTLSTLDIAVESQGEISDINVVDLAGTHTWVADLTIYLQGPDGTEIQLQPQICGSEDNFDLNYDDEAAPGAPPCPPTDGGSYQPVEPLSTFDNMEVSGTWTLRILDNANGDGGTLQSWGLEITYTSGGAESGTLRGQVTDASTGEPLVNATVFADVVSTSTDSNGNYTLPLPVGTYDVSAEAAGYVSETVTDVEIVANEETTLDFALEPDAATAIQLDALGAAGQSGASGALALAALLLGAAGVVVWRRVRR